MTLLTMNLALLQSHSSIESLQALKFDNFKVEIKAYCPLLWQVLLGAATRTRKEEHSVTYNKRDVKPHIIVSVAMFGYAKEPRTMKAFQDSFGIQLWYTSARRQVCRWH